MKFFSPLPVSAHRQTETQRIQSVKTKTGLFTRFLSVKNRNRNKKISTKVNIYSFTHTNYRKNRTFVTKYKAHHERNNI